MSVDDLRHPSSIACIDNALIGQPQALICNNEQGGTFAVIKISPIHVCARGLISKFPLWGTHLVADLGRASLS